MTSIKCMLSFFFYSEDSLFELVTYHNCYTKVFLWCVSFDLLLLSHSENLGSYGKPPLIFRAEFIFCHLFLPLFIIHSPMEQFKKFFPDREKFTRLRTQFFRLIWRNPPDRGKFSASEKSALLNAEVMGKLCSHSVQFILFLIIPKKVQNILTNTHLQEY